LMLDVMIELFLSKDKLSSSVRWYVN